MRNWKITGIIATLIVVLALPAYYIKVQRLRTATDRLQPETIATFVGSIRCRDCHKNEYDRWRNSHHDLAMGLASEETVLGDFNNAIFEIHGVTSRFFRKDDKFFVATPGPLGKLQEFEIKYTFGYYPLQQYLVPFAGGRLQCLPIAWDVKEKKWYHLYPDEPISPNEWLYWTNAGQNWNGMCAECHSTNLKKNFDHRTDTYSTTWSDINVGCEACHGPGSEHLAWAEMPEMARPQTVNYELVVKTSGIDSRRLVELCAPCHSRRAALGDYTHAEPDLLDSLLPQFLAEDLYYPDGQILEEVYVYGSFTQSKMYHRDVRCSDCHDVHSLKRVKDGNALCLQCHRAADYDTKEHHFHKQKGEKGEPIKAADGTVLFDVGTGAQCEQCHMPGRDYMGIDYRPDHSFRIPRPDLSMTLATPNACNRCHAEKTAQWSDETISKWYGPGRTRHYGTLIEAGRNRKPGAAEQLILLARDPLYPVIVRTTALALLSAYPGDETDRTYEMALMDEEALIRRTAVEQMHPVAAEERIGLLAGMLYDPVKAVRMEAARRFAGPMSHQLDASQKAAFQAALHEFESSMEYSADFAFARFNLGNLYAVLGQPKLAVQNYQAAIAIDNLFYPAKVNLAMLYNQRGQNDDAEALLREVVQAQPELHDIAYSLGLLLAEKKQYGAAVFYLKKAAEGMPHHPRVHYNLGLLLQSLQQEQPAEVALSRAFELEPENLDFMYALADYYLKRGRFSEARPIAEEMVRLYPDQRIGHDILGYIKDK